MKAIYDKLSNVPANALKAIQAGRLKGKSDINPQWRIEAMTEVFGLCGIGWKYVVTRKWTEKGEAGQIFAFADVELFIKVDDEWSDAIPGSGGNMLIVQEKAGLHHNDEAYKMAITDALSVAMKFIGVAAGVYRGVNDGSKYSDEKQQEKQPVNFKTNKPTCGANALQQGVERIKAGEQGVIEKMKAALDLTQEQIEILNSYVK